MERAWQVEAAETPEVRANIPKPWTGLLTVSTTPAPAAPSAPDRSSCPLVVPRGSDHQPHATASTVKAGPSAPSGGKSVTVTLPRLPGSDAAASVVNSVTAFSAGVVGNVASFTGAVTNVTNPPPAPSSSTFRSSGGRSGGSSGSCACACACAGCACACAGGGR